MRGAMAAMKMASMASVLLVVTGLAGCATWHTITHPLLDTGMERSAEKSYAQGLRYLEAGRFELAQEQFAIVEQTATSPELQQLAHEGQAKAAAIIAGKR